MGGDGGEATECHAPLALGTPPPPGSGCIQASSPRHLIAEEKPTEAPGWWVWGGLARRGRGALGCGALARPRLETGPASSHGVSVVGYRVWWELRA